MSVYRTFNSLIKRAKTLWSNKFQQSAIDSLNLIKLLIKSGGGCWFGAVDTLLTVHCQHDLIFQFSSMTSTNNVNILLYRFIDINSKQKIPVKIIPNYSMNRFYAVVAVKMLNDLKNSYRLWIRKNFACILQFCSFFFRHCTHSRIEKRSEEVR